MFFFAVENVGGVEAFMQLFENNLINWLVLVAVLVYFWNKSVPPMFKSREEQINLALKEAALAKKQGEELLEEQKKLIANAEAEAKQILEDAKHLAQQLKEQMQMQAAKDASDLKSKIEQQINNERQLAITQLRQVTASASIRLTEKVLPALLDEKAKAHLVTQFVEQLDNISPAGQSFSANSLQTTRK